jgi:hypothetical protein
LFVGICNETSNTTFLCLCTPGWEGTHCEIQINYCEIITCQNKGLCRPLFMNYTCECLGDSYFGRHCEIIAPKILMYKIFSKSSASIAIIAMASVVMFVIIMDALKYFFHIDLIRAELERIRREKQLKKKKHQPIIIRYIYVNAQTVRSSSEDSSHIIRESTV